MQDTFDDVQGIVLKSILIAESRGPWGRIGADIDKAANDNIYF